MATATLYAGTVEQPNRNTRYYGHSCSMAIDHRGKSEGYRCANCSDPRYYHEWSWLENLKEPNKPTQCGRPNGKPACNHATYYGIAGYRNVCPIAGCSGTYVAPAIIKLSNFDFKKLGIDEHSTIYSITVNWQHRCRGVDVSTTRETRNSPPNFNGFNHYPDRTVVESYFARGDTKLATLHGLHGVKAENPPNSDSFQGVGAATAYNLAATDVIDPNFALYIQYGQNLSTNPGNLYITDVCITIEYENGKPVILSPSDNQELYTNIDTECNCYTTIEHKVIGNWLHTNMNVGDVMTRKPLTVMLDATNCPEGVSVIDTTPTNTYNKTYKITDHSGVPGEKCISYYLKEYPEKRVDVWFTAKIYNKPEISVNKKYYKDIKKNDKWQLFDESKAYITAKKGCSDYISIWFDTVNKPNPDLKFGCLDPSQENLLKAYQNEFYSAIQNLECGNHFVFIKNGTHRDEVLSFIIELVSPAFSFTISDSETGDWQQDRTANGVKDIIITRTDSVGIETIPITVQDNTQNYPTNPNPQPIKTYDINSGESITHQMNKYYAGTFPLIVKPSMTDCDVNTFKEEFTVIPYHKQHYDKLFVRGEDSTSFDYDYLVAWEADNVRVPIKPQSVELGATVDDIQICTDNAYIGIGETGLLSLKITNIGGRGTIHNLQIELNAVEVGENNDLTVSTDEWELQEGLFYKERLMEDFYIYNEAIKNNVSLKIDRDNQNASDAENVYLYIRQLEEDSTIEVLIPFESRNPRTAYLQFLIFEQVQKIYWNNCQTQITNNPVDNIIKIKVLDSLATNMTITGKNDILYSNLNDCPIECYATDLTYNITNIDSSDLSNIEVINNVKALTKIQNSIEMLPYKYNYNGEGHDIEWNNGEYKASDDLIFYRKPFDRRIKLPQQLLKAHIRFPNLPEVILPIRTNDNGSAMLPISIPVAMQGKYSIKKLLSNYVLLEYAGDSVYKYCDLYINDEEYQQKEEVQPSKTKIEYIGMPGYQNNEMIPKDTDITIKYKVASNEQLLNQKSIQVFLKNDDEYELNQITVSSNSFNEFVHNIPINTYQSTTTNDIISKYDDTKYTTTIQDKCIKVIDGDTIKTQNYGTIRLVGVNTPEIGMLGADVSKYFVEKLCLNKQVQIKIDSQNKKDKYNRTLAVIIIDNKNLNEMLLKEGLATIMYIPPSEFNPYSWGNNVESYGTNIQFTITNPKEQTLNDLINSISLVFAGDSLYKPYNVNNIALSNNKIPTTIEYLDTYRSYRQGQVANVKVTLYAIENLLDNYIDFRPNLNKSGSSDSLTVSYKMCNLKNNKGEFFTKFQTNDERLIKNEVSKTIYCGTDTSATIKYKLNSEVIQQSFINILNISLMNGPKDNKDVSVEIDLTQALEKYKGDYKFISIETEDGDYALENNQIITWSIGDMEKNTETRATIKIRANEIGLSKIKIKAFDYLHSPKAVSEYEKDIGYKECEECQK